MTALEHALSSRVEGKTKLLEPTAIEGELCVTFKDTATAFNGQKRSEIEGKGALNAQISALLFQYLEKKGIATCFLRAGEKDNQLIYKPLAMISLEVVVRNIALGSAVKRYGFSQGDVFKRPVVEFFYKSQDDPLITEDVIMALGLIEDAEQLREIRCLALKMNDCFNALFESCGITCADFKVEFGLNHKGQLILGDELSPDNFRLRDAKTGDVLDKDLFRLDLGDVGSAYRQILARLTKQSLEAPLAQEQSTQKTSVYQIDVNVYCRKGILSPESRTVLETVKVLGYDNQAGVSIRQLSAGKRFQLEIEAPDFSTAEAIAHRLANDVLSNPVIEDFSLQVH